MNIVQLYECIKQYALTIPIVESYYNTSVYECWNNQNVKYGSVVFAVKSVRETNSIAKYDCVLYYGDRLNDNKTNRDAIQSDAVGVINSIVNQLNCSDKIEFVTYPVQSTIFEQKFADELAGAYANITIDLQSNGECCGLNPLDDYYTKYEVDELIKNVEVDLSDYYTKEQIDDMLSGSTKIPYIYVEQVSNGVYKYSDGSDFEGVKQAIINKTPYFIYIPSILGYYSMPTDVSFNFGQINANAFVHTSGASHHYFRYILHSDSIKRTESDIEYATYNDLIVAGVWGMNVEVDELTGNYVTSGVDFATLYHFINTQSRQYAIYFPSVDNTYRIAAEDIRIEDSEIKCKTVVINDEFQTTTEWTISKDEYDEVIVRKDSTTTIELATTDYVSNLIDNIDVDLSNYYTKNETQTNFYTKGQIDAIVGDINEVLDSLINDVDTSAIEAKLNSILNDK